jgi:hypothetical protein
VALTWKVAEGRGSRLAVESMGPDNQYLDDLWAG